MENTEAALEAGRLLNCFRQISFDGKTAPAIVGPEGTQLTIPCFKEVEAWFDHPTRKRGTFSFADVDSFVRYFNEHKEPDSRIFAKIEDSGASFSATLDFHGEGPSFNQHVCATSLRSTHEFTVWCASNRKVMTQAQFAQFLEDNAEMFRDPAGADLLELIQTLEGKSNASISSAIKLQNRAIKFTYNEDVELKGGISGTQAGDMTLPGVITAAFSPFDGTGVYEFKARLRYKIAERKLSFWYEAINLHLVVRAIASDVLLLIEKQTGVQPFKV